MSIRLRLLIFIGLSLTLMWGGIAAWTLMDMRHELRTVLDDRLASSAHMVGGLMSQLPPSSVPINGLGRSPIDVIARDGLACEVSMTRGEVNLLDTVRTQGSPSLSSAQEGYGTYTLNGKEWRVYVLLQGGLRIATADRIDVRDGLLRDIVLSAAIPFVVALIGSLLLLWFAIGRGLAPLERVRRLLVQRRADDLAPMPFVAAPTELRPLMQTIEHLLERMQSAIVRERRFTDDAAHELRTPLTAIKTHLQVARLAQQKDPAGVVLTQALASANEGVNRMQSTLDQLLMLARLEAHEVQDAGIAPCTSARDAMVQAAEDVGAAHAKAPVRLQMRLPAHDINVGVAQPLLVSALRNLMDNAIRYSPDDTEVTVVCTPIVDADGRSRMRFVVQDRGPGLAQEDCTHAIERFWRRDSQAQGSGLGLSIVRAIATHYDGQLTLASPQGGGLIATLDLPVAQTDGA